MVPCMKKADKIEYNDTFLEHTYTHATNIELTQIYQMIMVKHCHYLPHSVSHTALENNIGHKL